MIKLQNIIFVAFTTLLFHVKAGAIEGGLQPLDRRAAYYGGFFLALSNDVCPAGTFSCLNSGDPGTQQVGPCCPSQTVCTSGGYCCPGSPDDDDCTDVVNNSPTCADPSWTLFESTTGNENSYICCPAGWEVDDAADCFQPSTTSEIANTFFQSTTQANNASPTNVGPTSAVTISGGSAATSTAAGGAESASTSSPGAGAAAPGTGSPTTTASPSATKKSAADRTMMIGGKALALAGVLAAVSLLL